MSLTDVFSRAVIVAVGLAACLGATARPASAALVGPVFEIIETAGLGNTGTYEVINNSGKGGTTREYIYAFSVSNPLAASVKDSTTERGWIAYKLPLLGHKTAFAYGTSPGQLVLSQHKQYFFVNSETIGPGEDSSKFFFGTSLLASDATLLLVDQTGHFSSIQIEATDVGFSNTPAVPELSTWAMLLIGFLGIGFMAHRRKSLAPGLRLTRA